MPEPPLADPDPRPDAAVPRPVLPEGRLVDSWRARWEEPRVRIAVLLLVAGVAGFVWFRLGRSLAAGPAASGAPAAAGPVRSSPAAADRSARAATTATTHGAASVVHVAGAVARPGVVRMPAGGRVVDAIEAAGGGVPGADLDALNLAAKVADGQRILVPRVGEPPPPPLEEPGAPADAGGTGATDGPAAPVNLNTASSAALEELPGIGPALAQAIIRYREEHDGFRAVAELQEVRGIGDARFADLEPLVAV